MNITSTFRIGFLVFILGFIIASSLHAQQEGEKEKLKRDDQDQRIKAIGIDSVPATIFPPRKELTETEKEAQRLFVEGSKKGKSKNYKGSIEDFTASLALVQNSNSYMKRGYAYLLSGQFPLALQDFTETLRLTPANREAIFGRGVARFEMKDYTGAEVDLKQYLDLVNINAMAFDYMAALCFMRQDFQCALQNYSDVIRCDSLYLDAVTNRAMIRHYLRDYKGALEDYDVAIKQNPNDKKIYNNRAAAKMLLKDYKAALEDFNKAIELDPLYADAYNNRGRVRHHLGDVQGACSDWHKALSFGIEASRDLIIKNCK
ncbi:MAG: tetratricopeptide repeat protein [Bacteroidia bacterium]|nr:tetratricopeptide repeat protein [Bacteroidia bacterium]